MTSLDAVRNRVPLRARHRLAEARVRTRAPTARWRRLPDFLVIGAQRCGTSSLFRYLRGHPDVAASVRKEVEYFSRRYDNGQAWYRAHFALAAGRRATRQAFEATPDYLFHPLVAARVAHDLPACRFIVLLRDPVDRAVSHHQHMTRLGFETAELGRALDLEAERTGPDLRRLQQDPSHDARALLRYSYLARGHYAEQLARWFALFDRDRFLILAAEDLYARPATTFERVQRFLAVGGWNPPEFANHSATAAPRHEVDPEVRRRLSAHFEPHDAALTELIGWRPRHGVTA